MKKLLYRYAGVPICIQFSLQLPSVRRVVLKTCAGSIAPFALQHCPTPAYWTIVPDSRGHIFSYVLISHCALRDKVQTKYWSEETTFHVGLYLEGITSFGLNFPVSSEHFLGLLVNQWDCFIDLFRAQHRSTSALLGISSCPVVYPTRKVSV